MSASVTAFTSRATFVHPRCRSMSLGKEAVRKNNSVMGLRDKLPVQKLIRYSGYGRGEQRCALGVEMKHIRLIMPRGKGFGLDRYQCCDSNPFRNVDQFANGTLG